MLLLDTCALVWYTLDQAKLSPAALAVCSRIPREGAFVSSISLWEIGLKIKNAKLDINTSIEDYVQRLRRFGRIAIVPVDERIWLANLALDWEHKDPADRTIVATAQLENLPLVTSDSTIAGFYRDVIW